MVIIGQVNEPNEGLVFAANNVQFKIDQQIIGTGNVFISQSSLIWQPNNGHDGITIFWKRISVHGIGNSPTKSIYFVIDNQIKWPGANNQPASEENGTNGDENSESDEEIFVDAEEDQMTECWLLPDDINVVDVMYQAMTECQALHPDSEDSISGDSDLMEDDESGDFDDAGEFLNGNGDVENKIGTLSLQDERFADADE